MTQSNNNMKESSIESFLYVVAMSLILIVIPVFEKMEINIWTKTIIALVITFISYYLIKIILKYLKRKMALKSFKIKLITIYITYFLIYFIIRITLDI